MDLDFKQGIIELLNRHSVMTLATLRRDGWPQATMVSYANDGLVLYGIVGRNTQKYANVMRDPRVSVAIGQNCAKPTQIKGLSLGGRGIISTDKSSITKVREMVSRRTPAYNDLSPAPDPVQIAALRIEPEVVSIIDYSRGLGHSDLVKIAGDEVELLESHRHHWAGLVAV